LILLFSHRNDVSIKLQPPRKKVVEKFITCLSHNFYGPLRALYTFSLSRPQNIRVIRLSFSCW
jgi:hypothetical protein